MKPTYPIYCSEKVYTNTTIRMTRICYWQYLYDIHDNVKIMCYIATGKGSSNNTAPITKFCTKHNMVVSAPKVTLTTKCQYSTQGNDWHESLLLYCTNIKYNILNYYSGIGGPILKSFDCWRFQRVIPTKENFNHTHCTVWQLSMVFILGPECFYLG